MASKTSRKDYSASSSMSDTKLNCVIAKGTSIEGDFNTSENVRIDGVIKGNIECQKKLVLGASASIEGKLLANEAVIMGNIQGDVVVKGLLKLESTALIKGDITAQKIIVEEGARYDGISKIGG
jgi:cytoskeletal protein CcmA (bactofilin family)